MFIQRISGPGTGKRDPKVRWYKGLSQGLYGRKVHRSDVKEVGLSRIWTIKECGSKGEGSLEGDMGSKNKDFTFIIKMDGTSRQYF